jgi:FkbM family methyltransferase
MNKWQKFKHRVQLATAYRWFLSLENDLARLGMSDPSIVFDVGAHLGQTALHFRKSFRTATIHCFEPVEDNFKKLKLNTKGRDRIHINQLALGSSQDSVTMKTGQSDQTHQVCRNPEKLHFNGKIPTVMMETIDSYMKRENIKVLDLLKIDVEGYELEVLQGADSALQKGRVQAVLAECDFNPEDTQHTYFNDLWDFMLGKDFSFFGLYDVIHYETGMGIGFCNALFIRKPLPPAKESS